MYLLTFKESVVHYLQESNKIIFMKYFRDYEAPRKSNKNKNTMEGETVVYLGERINGLRN